MSCRANESGGAAAGRTRRRAGVVAWALAGALLAGCEHAAPSAPVELPLVERPVVALKTKEEGARVSVPSAALIERGGIPGVFVLQAPAAFPPPAKDADGKSLPQARFRMVKVGKAIGDRVEVLSGLAGDEVLVLGDLSQVHDGSPIVVRR